MTDASSSRPGAPAAPFVESAPRAPVAPVVFDSPHSGFAWPDDFRPVAPLEAVRSTWDAHVDALLGDAPTAGVALLAACFPRAYVDVNRDRADLDAALLREPWPGTLAPTDYSRRGMGLVRRLALPGVPMYAAPLSVAEVRSRLERWYDPYRARLAAMLDDVHGRRGLVWHVNWHSMKSVGNAMNRDAGAVRPDVVVSDRQGTTAAPALTARIAAWFGSAGYQVSINAPYQGGDLVRHFGRPAHGCSSVQVELNRRLYLDEATATPTQGFDRLRADLSAFAMALAGWAHEAADAR